MGASIMKFAASDRAPGRSRLPSTITPAHCQRVRLELQRATQRDTSNAVSSRVECGLQRSGMASLPRKGQNTINPATRAPDEHHGGQRRRSRCESVQWPVSLHPPASKCNLSGHTTNRCSPQQRVKIENICNRELTPAACAIQGSSREHRDGHRQQPGHGRNRGVLQRSQHLRDVDEQADHGGDRSAAAPPARGGLERVARTISTRVAIPWHRFSSGKTLHQRTDQQVPAVHHRRTADLQRGRNHHRRQLQHADRSGNGRDHQSITRNGRNSAAPI